MNQSIEYDWLVVRMNRMNESIESRENVRRLPAHPNKLSFSYWGEIFTTKREIRNHSEKRTTNQSNRIESRAKSKILRKRNKKELLRYCNVHKLSYSRWRYKSMNIFSITCCKKSCIPTTVHLLEIWFENRTAASSNHHQNGTFIASTTFRCPGRWRRWSGIL